MKPLKMYICIKQSIPSHKCLGVAHGVLMAHLKFVAFVDYQKWINESFRKVVVEVTNEQFEKIKEFERNVIVTESGLDNQEIAVVFCPRPEWPEIFKTFPFLKV